MQELINSYKREITHKDNPSSHKLKPRNTVRTNPKMSKPKFTVTTEYLGTVNNEEVAEEIITILKEEFLSKISTDPTYLSALQSPSNKEMESK